MEALTGVESSQGGPATTVRTKPFNGTESTDDEARDRVLDLTDFGRSSVDDAASQADEDAAESTVKISKPNSPVVNVPTPSERPSFELLQKWEGVVIDVKSDVVRARLTDLSEPSNADEIVEILRAEISDADEDLLQPGAVFYWRIGYERSLAGTLRRTSEIYFRRLPKWTERDLEKVRQQAREWSELF